MTATKSLGICMDHAHAHLIEFNSDTADTKTVESKFSHQEKEEALHKGENLMHNKQQHEEHAYYKDLGNIIRNYDSVVLFGPTDAKAELYNMLKADHNFSKIKIEVKAADKMTEHQEHAFVKDYFKN